MVEKVQMIIFHENAQPHVPETQINKAESTILPIPTGAK
jgi:hypothetical protein